MSEETHENKQKKSVNNNSEEVGKSNGLSLSPPVFQLKQNQVIQKQTDGPEEEETPQVQQSPQETVDAPPEDQGNGGAQGAAEQQQEVQQAEGEAQENQVSASLASLLNRTGSTGWHIAMQQDSISRNFTYRAGQHGTRRRARRVPTLGGTYPRSPEVSPIENETLQSSRQELITHINQQLSHVQIPTNSGEMLLKQGRMAGGFAYRARTNERAENETRTNHMNFMRDASLEDIGFTETNRRTRTLWRLFREISTQEGDTSSMNAYDDQIVTIGAGYSARSGDAGMVYNQMPAAFHDRLYSCGIKVNDDNSFTVFDPARGVVVTGQNALRVIQVNEAMLGLLVQEAQSTREISSTPNEEGESQTMGQRNWMYRAQFNRFIERNRRIPNQAFSWPYRNLKFGIKLKHWMGALSWRGIAAAGGSTGNIEGIANYIYNHPRVRPRFSDTAELQRRIRQVARRTGNGGATINFVDR